VPIRWQPCALIVWFRDQGWHAMLDLVSNGRAELGIGEGATRLELGGFNIPAKEKRIGPGG